MFIHKIHTIKYKFVSYTWHITFCCEVFWVVEAGQERGVDAGGLLERKLGAPGTTRYWHVVEAVAALAGGLEEDTVRDG